MDGMRRGATGAGSARGAGGSVVAERGDAQAGTPCEVRGHRHQKNARGSASGPASQLPVTVSTPMTARVNPKYTVSAPARPNPGASSNQRGTRRPASSGIQDGTTRPHGRTSARGNTTPASTKPTSNSTSGTPPPARTSNPTVAWAASRRHQPPMAAYAPTEAQPGGCAGRSRSALRPQNGQTLRHRRRYPSAAAPTRMPPPQAAARLRDARSPNRTPSPGSSPPTTSKSRGALATSSAALVIQAATSSAGCHHALSRPTATTSARTPSPTADQLENRTRSSARARAAGGVTGRPPDPNRAVARRPHHGGLRDPAHPSRRQRFAPTTRRPARSHGGRRHRCRCGLHDRPPRRSWTPTVRRRVPPGSAGSGWRTLRPSAASRPRAGPGCRSRRRSPRRPRRDRRPATARA
jgi:hypothetical protein